MIVAPETEIYLLKCPLEEDQQNQLDFVSDTAQVNYFQSLPKLALMNCTYQRENNTMWVKFNIEAIRNYNYVMYKNNQYGNKWFYAFITGMDYENNVVTGVHIRTDVFQTYLFEYQWKQSYVKRETVSDDTFGKHLIPENFDLGDYILNDTDYEYFINNTASSNNKSALIVVQCSERIGICFADQQATTPVEDMYIINGIPQGCWYYIYKNTEEQVGFLREVKKYLDGIGKGNAILNMFLIPPQVVDLRTVYLALLDKDGYPTSNFSQIYIPQNNSYLPKYIMDKTITRPTTFGKGSGAFTPVNNKTLTYPYNYLLVTNNNGNAIDFHYEDFNGNPRFKATGVLSATCCYMLQPNNSLKSNNPEYGMSTEVLMGMQLPTLSWNSDYYLNWVAQNSNSIKQQKIQKLTDIAGNVITDAFKGAMATGSPVGGLIFAGATALSEGLDYSNFVETMEEERRQADSVPDTVQGNFGGGDLVYSMALTNVGFKFYNYQIRKEVAQKVDRFFSMYGYRVNEIKTPNTKTRQYWNFLQTINANIQGNIPQVAIDELKAIFNKGITIWHDSTHFLDYSLTNSIL